MLWLMPWTPASCGGELDLGLPCGQQVPDPIAITAAPRMCAGRRLGWESEPCVTLGTLTRNVGIFNHQAKTPVCCQCPLSYNQLRPSKHLARAWGQ